MSHDLKCVFVQISESLVQDILKLSGTSLTHMLFCSVLFHLQVFLYFRLFFKKLPPSFIDSVWENALYDSLKFELWPTMLSTSIKVSSELKSVHFDVVEENIL